MGFLRTSWLLVFLAHSVFASDLTQLPNCDGPQGPMPFINPTVLNWKATKPNQFKARAFIEGVFVRETLDRDSHYQFIIQIGPDAQRDIVEVIYNKEFGQYPVLVPGMPVVACGDFINAFRNGGGYSASPAGAIIHWVHWNPGDRDGGRHQHGFMVLGGQVVGYDHEAIAARARPGR